MQTFGCVVDPLYALHFVYPFITCSHAHVPGFYIRLVSSSASLNSNFVTFLGGSTTVHLPMLHFMPLLFAQDVAVPNSFCRCIAFIACSFTSSAKNTVSHCLLYQARLLACLFSFSKSEAKVSMKGQRRGPHWPR